MNRKTFLGAAALGCGAVLANVSSGSAAPGPGDDVNPDTRPVPPSKLQAVRGGGLSPARLARMHDVMAGHVERGDVPGLVTLISRRGEVHADALGKQAIGGDPMRRDTIFRIASLSKPITAAATMILEIGRASCRERV